MTDAQRRAARAEGEAWFATLRDEHKWSLGDEFVLDTFDWRDWFERKPKPGFLSGAENARLLWEMTR